ncbi:UDPGP type 1 family protein [bacterium]|nr:UDPGP type 1 family protein [bacterium]
MSSEFSIDKLKATLEKYHQSHVLRYWGDLDNEERKRLIDQLDDIDFNLVLYLASLLKNTKKSEPLKMSPAPVIDLPETKEEKAAFENARTLGEEVIRAGRVGAFLVAGGQGSRLGFDGPKGCYPIGPVSGKSLFQMHAEKILSAQRRCKTVIPWYIMTSETNDGDTRRFFERYHYFGLKSSDVMFFKQRMVPALNEDGQMILDRKDHIFTSPNGHGGSLQAMMESGAIANMKERGIDVISYFQVDNVLIQILDPLFIGFHVQANAEMSSKMLRKRGPYEKLGHFGLVNGQLQVVEYSDMQEADMQARNQDGRLKYGAGSPAIHLIQPDFIVQEMEGGIQLPYHVARKKIPYLNQAGKQMIPDRPNGYKFEMFVFDALRDTRNSVILEAVREHEFSPVKNKTGQDSPETARRDLSNYFGEWLEAAGIEVPRDKSGNVRGVVEIGPLFADCQEAFVKKISQDVTFDGSFYLDG